MADPPAADTGHVGHGDFGFLTRKVGPLPVWMWALIIAGGYYWYKHYGPGATSAGATATSVQPTTTTDVINEQRLGGSQYKTNSEWEAAAVNLLVGESVPPTQATTALYKYLHSQPLAAQEQKDINLAIDGIGPPPNIPAPATVTKPKPKAPGPKPRQPGPKRPKPKPAAPDQAPGATHHPSKTPIVQPTLPVVQPDAWSNHE